VNVGDTKGSSKGKSKGTSKADGSSSTSGTSTTSTTQEGGPWWYAYQKLRLKRRKMQSELVLKDMIASFTKAYNEGRQINDERYDELVALYAIMLSRTEDEANAFGGLSTEDFKPLADAVVAACKDALEKYGAAADDIPADWLASRTEEINRKFDALVAQAKSKMVSEGTYNSTVWPTTVSGIERDRQIALNGLKDDMVTLKVDVLGKIAAMKADIGQKLLDCEIRIIEAQQKMLLGPTEIRNTVFKWMLDFMERREDDYPGLEQIATIAGQLGYAEGGAAGAGTAA
jgi:CRISPR/Cas system CSM-associated protein Csm2 small subunit